MRATGIPIYGLTPFSLMKTTFRKLTMAWLPATLLLLPTLTRAEIPVQAWFKPYNGGFAVVVDGNDAVIVAGSYATTKYSSAGVPLWTNSLSWPYNSFSEAYAVTVDSDNNVLVTGLSGSSPTYHSVTTKYSSAGLPLWTNRYVGDDYDDATDAVAVDGNNDVIVTGFSLRYPSGYGYATVKYSSAGLPLWTNRCDAAAGGHSGLCAVATDRKNDVVVTGTVACDAGSFRDYITIKYSSAGVPLWTNRYHASTNCYSSWGAAAVAVDTNRDVIVAGVTDLDYTTIKYSSAGMPLWTNHFGPRGTNNPICAMALDRDGNVFVTGTATGNGGYSDYVTIKYSSPGPPLWTNYYNGPGNGNDYPCTVAVDGSNNVIVTGFSTNNAGGNDYVTIKYSGGGLPLWTNRCNGPGNSIGWSTGLAVDSSGNVIFTGQSIRQGISDFLTIKYICVPSPALSALQVTNGTFRLRVDHVLQPGTLVIEACTDLAGWLPIFTNTTPTNVLYYTDPDATNYLGRFYRVYQSP